MATNRNRKRIPGVIYSTSWADYEAQRAAEDARRKAQVERDAAWRAAAEARRLTPEGQAEDEAMRRSMEREAARGQFH